MNTASEGITVAQTKLHKKLFEIKIKKSLKNVFMKVTTNHIPTKNRSLHSEQDPLTN